MKWVGEDRLGTEILVALNATGKSQAWLSRASMVSDATIERIVSGKARNVRATTLAPIARAMGWEFDPRTLMVGIPDDVAPARVTPALAKLHASIREAAQRKKLTDDQVAAKLDQILTGDDAAAYQQLRGAASRSEPARRAVERKRKGKG